MRARTLAYAAATAVVAALTPAAPVAAQAAAPAISVSPTTPKPGDSITVTGTSDCASVAYTVTLTYAAAAGGTTTATATGTTDASGAFTQALTVPETAVAGGPAHVAATVACDGGDQTSNEVPLTIEAHEGTLAADPTAGPPGTEVTVSGTNCWGGEVVVAFGDGEEFPFEVTDVVLAADRTFTATFVIPDEAGTGEYFFAAECPGTDFPLASFKVAGGPDEPVDDGEVVEEGESDSGTDGSGGDDAESTGVSMPSSGEVPATAVGGTPSFTG